MRWRWPRAIPPISASACAATWSHRNLFGNAEQLNLTAAGTGLGSSTAGMGYNLSAQFLKPHFLRPDQTLEFDLSGVKQDLDAYDQTAETLAAFLRRKFSPLWTARVGLSAIHDDVAQEGSDTVYQLLGRADDGQLRRYRAGRHPARSHRAVCARPSR